MADYKETLNLPQTAFPMKANLPKREPEMLAYWQEIDLYGKLAAQGQDRATFILHDGPPYANGHLHLGHSVNKTLKDIVTKAKTLSGFYAPYVPGWDCHGLPIELNVEKKIGKVGPKLSAQDFRAACRDYAQSQVSIQREEFKRLGILGDWEKPYLTMSKPYEANIIRNLAKIVANGHLTLGRKPVHWCVDCGSALAEAEVEYQDKQSPSIDVRFSVVEPVALAKLFDVTLTDQMPVSFLIWTTTPWTLPANRAVALNPEHEYALIQANNEVFVIAQALVDTVIQRYGMDDYRMLATTQGKQLEHLKLQHPFLAITVPVVLGDHVTFDSGTGCVHTAPAHGQEDYVIGQKYQLEMHNPVDNRGCFYADEPHFAGLHVFKANGAIVELLTTNQALVHHENIAHSYPHCWRHKTPLIFRATPQWFISMDKAGLRQSAMQAIEKVTWIPGWGKERILDMVEKRPDWCISRQRIWGTPLPLFVHSKTSELHPNTQAIMEEVAVRVEQEGIEVWDTLTAKSLLGPEAADYEKVTDTLDVWFDSGVSHGCVLKQNDALGFPAHLYLEGSDQHRGWFQSSLITSVAINDCAPFEKVLTHGFTVDADGHKMSKSLGNTIAPEKVINHLGADVLRLWVAATDYRAELNVSDEILKRTSDTYRRIRNTARFLLSNLSDFSYADDAVQPEDLLTLDRWAVSTTLDFQQDIIEAYDNYHFHHIAKKIHHFCSIEMGGFYLDIIKDRLYTCQQTGLPRRSAQTAMYHILHAVVHWLAPIVSFTAEEIWQNMPGAEGPSVFLSGWYQGLFATDAAQKEQWQTIIAVRNEVNKALESARNTGGIGSSLAANVTLYVADDLHSILSHLKDELRFVLICSSASLAPISDCPTDAVSTELKGLSLSVTASEAEKCSRCWHRLPDVNQTSSHPGLCGRCVENVAGVGEARSYA